MKLNWIWATGRGPLRSPSAIILNHSVQCSSKRRSSHGMKWEMPASRRSRIWLPRVPPSHSVTMTEGNQSQYRRMPPKEDLVRAYYRMAQPLRVTERDHQAKKTSHIVDIVHRLLMGSKVKVTRMATRRCSGLTVQWGPMFFVSFSWNLYY